MATKIDFVVGCSGRLYTSRRAATVADDSIRSEFVVATLKQEAAPAPAPVAVAVTVTPKRAPAATDVLAPSATVTELDAPRSYTLTPTDEVVRIDAVTRGADGVYEAVAVPVPVPGPVATPAGWWVGQTLPPVRTGR